MFNRGVDKQIEKTLRQVVSDNIWWYKAELIKLSKTPLEKIDFNEFFNEINIGILNRILESVAVVMNNAPAYASTRYFMLFMNPASCGYDYDEDYYSLGILYCFMYFALTGKKAKAHRAIQINHILDEYKQIVAKELDYEHVELNL